jgi:hypothetical protein
MNLNVVANAATKGINPNTTISVLKSTGYTIGTGRKQVPTYAAAVTAYGNIQALDGKDLQQISGLNIQGTIRALFINTDIKGTSRPDGTGGDLLQFSNETWLVVKVLESWNGWTKAAIVKQ